MPTKAERKQLDATVATFHAHYAAPANGWGQERWHNSLYPALSQPTRYAALANQFVRRADVERTLLKEVPEEELRVVELPALRHGEEEKEEKRDEAGMRPRILLYERVPANVAAEWKDSKGEREEMEAEGGKGTEAAADKTLPFPLPKPITIHTPPHQPQQLLTHWNMDAASALAAHILDVQPGDKVLDLCSAPGGKSVALAQLVFADYHHDQQNSSSNDDTPKQPRGCLHTNEPDAARAKRLLANLRCYLPAPLFTSKAIQTFTLDASIPSRFLSTLPHGSGGYDRVLLDAPCSSERHVIHAHTRAAAGGRIADDMARWRAGTSRALQKTQAGLLVTALRAVRRGGRMLYSTCSVERGENDGVVERVRETLEKERRKGSVWVRGWDVQVEMGRKGKRGGGESEKSAWEIVEKGLEAWSEETDYGRIVVPDGGEGRWGPLFLCVITKVERLEE